MTITPAATSEMDHLDQLGAKAFDGFLVRKDLVRKDSRQYPVPTQVVEFLLGRYCASTDPDKGARCALEKRSYSRPSPVIRAAVKIIDIVRARLDTRLDTRSDSYAAEVPSLAIKDAQIDDELVRANERMLTDGFYAEVSLEYDPVIAQERNGRPFRIAGLRPIQMSNPNVLGPRGTGKSHRFQQISPYSHLISGDKATVAKMFVNGNGQRGLVCQYDVVCFDEVAGVSFDQKDGVNILKGQMASGEDWPRLDQAVFRTSLISESAAFDQECPMAFPRISHDPAVMGGKPCLRGLRITVGTIVGLIARGNDRERILQAYPLLEPADIDEALAQAAWRMEEREEARVLS